MTKNQIPRITNGCDRDSGKKEGKCSSGRRLQVVKRFHSRRFSSSRLHSDIVSFRTSTVQDEDIDRRARASVPRGNIVRLFEDFSVIDCLSLARRQMKFSMTSVVIAVDTFANCVNDG